MPIFTENWTKQFVSSISKLKSVGFTPARILEVGIFEGRSARAIKQAFPQVDYTGIDSWEFCESPSTIHSEAATAEVKTRAYANVGELSGCKIIESRAIPALMRLVLAGDKFDFIYIDGSHHKFDVNLESSLAWLLLPVGGILLWDDAKNSKRKSVKSGIDSFLPTVDGCYEEVINGFQYGIKKLRPEVHQIDFKKELFVKT